MLPIVVASLSVAAAGPWSVSQAQEWQKTQTWGAGCNFIPSTAINQLEMWQADTFDPTTLDREMGWMKGVGMTRARIYLHDLAYEQDPSGFKQRMNTLLGIAEKHGIQVMFVFFDDCWNDSPKIGPQPKPRPGVHNSGWVQSPAKGQRQWPADFARLKTYVQDVLKTFGKDRRVWIWDLYNEPSNSGYGEASEPLLRKVFEWAWELRPTQPLTVGPWLGGGGLDKLSVELSDVVTFHAYEGADHLRGRISELKKTGRPVICTEWMARTNGSRIETHLPIFKAEGVPCLQWGFVSGKSNTIFPWGSKEGSPEPELWFHDLLRPDGTPYRQAEVDLYRALTRG